MVESNHCNQIFFILVKINLLETEAYHPNACNFLNFFLFETKLSIVPSGQNSWTSFAFLGIFLPFAGSHKILWKMASKDKAPNKLKALKVCKGFLLGPFQSYHISCVIKFDLRSQVIFFSHLALLQIKFSLHH